MYKTTPILAASLSVIFLLGFVKNPVNKANKNGCSGSNCHVYRPGAVDIKSQANLKIQVKPKPGFNKARMSAQLLDTHGKILDFQSLPAKKKSFLLRAPRPGKYKVLIGYRLKKSYWDSMFVEIKPSIISLPVSSYGDATFHFFPIHPNPVRESTLARFILPTKTEVELSLFSISGKKVRTLFKGFLSEGIHEIPWETKDEHHRPLLAGNYLCELRKGTKKLVQSVYIEK